MRHSVAQKTTDNHPVTERVPHSGYVRAANINADNSNLNVVLANVLNLLVLYVFVALIIVGSGVRLF